MFMKNMEMIFDKIKEVIRIYDNLLKEKDRQIAEMLNENNMSNNKRVQQKIDRYEKKLTDKEKEVSQLKMQVYELEQQAKKQFEEIMRLKKELWEKNSQNAIGIKLKNPKRQLSAVVTPEYDFPALGSDEEKYNDVFWVAYNLASNNDSALWIKVYKNKKGIIKTQDVCEPNSSTRCRRYLTVLPVEFHAAIKNKNIEIADKLFYDAFFRTRFDQKTLDSFASWR